MRFLWSLGKVLTAHQMATTNKSLEQMVSQQVIDWIVEGTEINPILALRAPMGTGQE